MNPGQDGLPGAKKEIAGFRINGYRTLHDVSIEIPGKVAVVCGPNNVGKSSLLTAIGGYPALLKHVHGTRPPDSDVLKEMRDGQIGCALRLTDPMLLGYLRSKAHRPEELDNFPIAVAEVGLEVVWLEVNVSKGQLKDYNEDLLEPLRRLFHNWTHAGGVERKWAQALSAIGGQANPAQARSLGPWFREVASNVLGVPEIRHISDIRRAVDQPLTEEDLRTLVVASGYSTTGARRENWARNLEQILQDVFGDEVRFEARPTADGPGEILLAIDGEADIPVDQVGAGVREVIAIAFRALSAGGADVLTIEEPENCLHPAAVRRLVRSLAQRAGVQVILSTHSAAVVNSKPDTVVELRRDGKRTESWSVADAGSRFRAVRALGHEPADLVMTPCAIWVEGPSDRLYLTAWLAFEGLREGLDYQVAFFGGALGSRISLANDSNPAGLLAEVRPLSRRCAFVTDTDRSAPRGALKEHVKRWRAETTDDPDAAVMLTWGREIENSLPEIAVNEYRKNVGKRRISTSDFRFARVMSGLSIPKVRFAEKMLEAAGTETPDNAVALVKDLAKFVRESA